MAVVNKINLQLGDIIKFTANENTKLDERVFLITYIDENRINIINNEFSTTIDILDSILQEESISQIEILHRENNKSYAIQNHLTPGISISIYFGGTIPYILTGKITNLEEDMIEILIFPSKDLIYIDFAYRGIPINLNIEKIVIIETLQDDYDEGSSTSMKKSYDGDFNEILDIKDDEFVNYDNEYIKEIAINIGSINIGPDLEEIEHNVNVEKDKMRHTLEKQIQDYIDFYVNKIQENSNKENNTSKIANEINRFIQLRKMYSVFDYNGNPEFKPEKTKSYKPLIYENLLNLEQQIDWVIPVTKMVKTIIFENTSDILLGDEYLKVQNLGNFIDELISVNHTWSNEKHKQSNYKNYIENLSNTFDNYNNINDYSSFTKTNNIFNVIVNNYDDFTGYIIKDNNISTVNYDFKTVNTGQTMLKSEYQNNKKIFNSIELIENDKINIEGLITLPILLYEYGLKNCNYTSILEKSNKSSTTFVLNHILNDNNIEHYRYSETDFISEKPIDNIQGDDILNNINYFTFDSTITDVIQPNNYINLLNCAIPSNDIVIKLLNSYYKYYNISQFNYIMQGFYIDNYTINYNSFLNVVKNIENNIIEYKEQYINNSKLIDEMIDAFSVKKIKEFNIDIKLTNYPFLNQKLRDELISSYELSDINLYTSEILNRINDIDSGNFLYAALNKNSADLIVSNLLDIYIKNQENKTLNPENKTLNQENLTLNQENKTLNQENKTLNQENCSKYVLSKKYNNIDDVINDNDKLIFFDTEYDKTQYSLSLEFTEQKKLMDDYAFMEFIKNQLIQELKIDKDIAIREAKAIVDGKREIIDHDYALLINKDTNKNTIFIRNQNQWVIDEQFLDNFFIENNMLFCNSLKECVSQDDKCSSINDIKEIKDNEQDKHIKTILRNFNLDYNISVEEIKKNINIKYDIALNYLKKHIHISRLKINLKEYNFIEKQEQIISPYQKLKDAIFTETNLSNRYNNIKKFCLMFTRDAIETENKYWLYCKKTGVKLLPIFFMRLANVFINKGDYLLELDNICAEQGTISDDNNFWVDKHSGYIIKSIEFSGEYMQEQSEINLTTSEILQQKYLEDKTIKVVLLPEVQNIINVVSAITKFLGVDLQNKNDFIINNVLSIQKNNVPPEKKYNDMIAKANKSEKTEKSNKFPPYIDFYNQSLIILTLSFILITIQTTVPSIQTRRTFPNCVKSFDGYPLNGEQDKSGLNYIVCVANKIKTNIVPWNSILKANEGQLIKKIEIVIEKNILTDKKILEMFDKKREHLIIHKETPINKFININWTHFYPPLTDFKIESENLINISPGFKQHSQDKIKSINKDYTIDVLKSKIIYFSGSIMESIKQIVKKQTPILSNNAGDPFLENACCHGVNNTLKYFINNDKSIETNIEIIKNLSNIIKYNKQLFQPCILFDITPFKRFDKLNINSYSEHIIYKAFIHYCKFSQNKPINSELKAICMDKPLKFVLNETMKLNIENLKEQGKIYNNDLLQELIQYISRQNINNKFVNTTIVSNFDNLNLLLEKTKNNQSVFDTQYFDLMTDLFDNFKLTPNELPQFRKIKNYFGSVNKSLKSSIVQYITIHTSSSKRDIQTLISNLELEFEVNNIKIIENYINNFINLFPNIILNKHIDYTKVHKHWKLSETHELDITQFITKYYKNLDKHSVKSYFKYIFSLIKNKCDILIKFLNYNKFSSYKYNQIFDNDYIILVYRYTIYTIINEFINLKNNDLFKIEILEYDDYDSLEFDKIICEIIESYLSIFFNHHNLISIGYKKMIEKINVAKEHEKKLITDYLKELTDEEREIQNIFKNNKLEKWSIGLQKGMTQYVKSTYDDERIKLEKQLEIDKKLKKYSDVTNMNSEIYKLDIEEEEQISSNIETEEYNMDNIPDDDDQVDDIDEIYFNDEDDDSSEDLDDFNED